VHYGDQVDHSIFVIDDNCELYGAIRPRGRSMNQPVYCRSQLSATSGVIQFIRVSDDLLKQIPHRLLKVECH
jgi:hypothetical protein